MVEFKLDFHQSDELVKAMAKIPERSEELVNKVLKSRGTKEMIQAIVGFMPVSNKKKQHAKYSNPLSYRMKNLGFIIFAKGGAANKSGSFGYLVFPEEGRGPHNPIAQRFFEKGSESSNEKILDLVVDSLIEAHNLLGGKN